MATRLFFQSSGDEHAQTILFLHGGGVAGWMWDPVVARMQDFHCLVPDLPEHGRSLQVKPFSMQLAAEQAVELIRDRANGGRAAVVGLSEGAQTVVQMLANTPEVIERALISSALLLPMAGLSWMYSAGLIGWMFRISVPPFRNNEWWMRLNMKYSAGIPDEYFPQYRNNFQIITEDQFVNAMIANQQFRLPGNLDKAAAPTLVIAGKHEYDAMKKSVLMLTGALPHAQARLLDLGVGTSMRKEHNWAMNAPDLFAQVLRNFIADQELPNELQVIQ